MNHNSKNINFICKKRQLDYFPLNSFTSIKVVIRRIKKYSKLGGKYSNANEQSYLQEIKCLDNAIMQFSKIGNSGKLGVQSCVYS